MVKKMRSNSFRKNKSIKNKKGGNCGCGSGNSTLSKMMNFGGKKRKTIRIRGGNVEFDAVGMPVNAISLNGHQDSPLYLVQSGRFYGGKKTRNHRKKGGMGFSDWTNSSNNPVIQFNTIPGANLSTGILSGTSYNNTPNNSMNLQFKPMV
jgi:hypothetical protein